MDRNYVYSLFKRMLFIYWKSFDSNFVFLLLQTIIFTYSILFLYRKRKVKNSFEFIYLETFRDKNFCIVNPGIKHWSPSYTEQRINLISLRYLVVVKSFRDNFNKLKFKKI